MFDFPFGLLFWFCSFVRFCLWVVMFVVGWALLWFWVFMFGCLTCWVVGVWGLFMVVLIVYD